jgi:acetylornithine/succinyldiaminopimelate/putrescine aminotransferase
MIGIELQEKIPAFAAGEKSAAVQFINALHQAGVLAIPAGTHVIRLLPPLNLSRVEAAEGAGLIESVVKRLSA